MGPGIFGFAEMTSLCCSACFVNFQKQMSNLLHLVVHCTTGECTIQHTWCLLFGNAASGFLTLFCFDSRQQNVCLNGGIVILHLVGQILPALLKALAVSSEAFAA